MYYPDCTLSIQPGSLVKMIHSFQYPAEIFLPIFSQILCLIYFHFEAKILRVTNAVTHSIVIVTKTINPSRPHTAPANRLRIRKSIPKTTRLRRAIVPSSQQARKQAMAKLEDRLRWIRNQRLKADTALFANH